jgi:hypothetical protein
LINCGIGEKNISKKTKAKSTTKTPNHKGNVSLACRLPAEGGKARRTSGSRILKYVFVFQFHNFSCNQ